MLTGETYSSGHLVPSHLALAYVLLADTNIFPELVVIFQDYAIQKFLGTFSILLKTNVGNVPIKFRLTMVNIRYSGGIVQHVEKCVRL